MPAESATILPIAVGRRERNKLRMKEHIYTTALSLFIEKGFEKTTIEEIAERADVARGTFVNHFQHKDELITTWSKQRQTRLEEKLQKSRREDDDVPTALRRCIAALAEINEEDRELNGVMLTAWVRAGLPITEEPRTAELFADAIRSGLESGQTARYVCVDPMQVGHLLRDAYLGALFRWCRSGWPGDAKGSLFVELCRILDIVLPGITET